jgi:hypothetical protein
MYYKATWYVIFSTLLFRSGEIESQLSIFFCANTTACPLWTSWPSLPVVVEV